MSASEALGMACMAGAGFAVAFIVACSTLTKYLGLPYYYLYGTGNLIIGAVLAAASVARGDVQRLQRHRWKWVLLRGLFGTGIFMLSLLAVAAGTPLGDTSALSSINVVASALLGRLFLGESIRALHGISLALSVVGAVLVSKPESLFGQRPDEGVPWLGYALAIAAGFVSGGCFIASRKSQGINPVVMTSSVALMEGAAHWVLPLCGVVRELPLESMAAAPWEALAVGTGYLLLGGLGSGALSVGAQLCPAAMSSTIFTAASMSLSYVLQTCLHHDAPDPLTMAGAGTMLSAVFVMAFARWFYSPAMPPPNTATYAERPLAASSSASSSAASGAGFAAKGDDDDELESLASFAASEWSGLSIAALRQRRAGTSAAAGPAPEALGHAGA